MKYKSFTSLKLIAALFLLAVAFSSCRSSKNSLIYFSDIQGLESGVLNQIENTITIQPADELFITISSGTPAVTAEYNVPLINPALSSQLLTPTQPQQQTYIVDSKGDIVMPVLGRIHVQGLTTDQLADDLLGMVSKDVADPYVRVELMNFRVNVLGEVKTPGTLTKPVAADHLTVLEALAMRGDVTEYSDRSTVMVLRKENGKLTYHRLNLNDSKSVESPYYYLRQNDVVIVPPSDVRQSNAAYDTNNSFKVQVISTIVSAVSVIASLVIALAVK